MSVRRLLLVLALAVLAAPAAAGAQGLGDIAARERESREKTPKKSDAPVYTNHDLDARRPPGSEDEAEEEGGGETAPPSSSPPSPSGGGYERRDADTALRTDAVNRAQAEVDSLSQRIRELNGRLNPMSTTYIYGAAGSGDAAGEEIRIRNEISQLERQLVEARQSLAQANEDLAAARQGSPRRGRLE